MDAVETIDPVAVAAFVATIKSREITVRGNQPRDNKCRQRLHAFGFFEHVQGVSSKGVSGSIRKEEAGTVVESETVQTIVSFAMTHLGLPPKHGPSYRVFGETIANTYQHADRRGGGKKPWWASTYYDGDEDRACFTSIDLGAGIVETFSYRQKSAEMREGNLLSPGHAERLLHGTTVPSRTGLPHRGRGLPSMREACMEGRIENLAIITNKAFAQVDKDTYEELMHGFPGTIVYWEVGSPSKEMRRIDDAEYSK